MPKRPAHFLQGTHMFGWFKKKQIKKVKENPVGLKKKEDGVFDTKPKN